MTSKDRETDADIWRRQDWRTGDGGGMKEEKTIGMGKKGLL